MSDSSFEIFRTILDFRIAEWESILTFFTAMVACGVLIEFITHRREFHESNKEREEHQRLVEEYVGGAPWGPSKPSFGLYIAGYVGIALVVIGVVGELFAQSKSESFEASLSTVTSTYLAQAEREAGQANERSKTAQKEAEQFQFQIADANKRAAEAGKAAEEDKLAREKIEEKLSGWQLNREGQKRLLIALKPYAKTKYDLTVNPSEFRFMRILDTILGNAGWIWQKPIPPAPNPENVMVIQALFADRAGLDFRSGLFVQVAKSRKDDLGQAATALVLGLREERVPAQGNIILNPDADPSAIHIIIGSRE